jgi:hypothetical protein
MATEGAKDYGKIHQTLERGASQFHARIADIDRQISELNGQKALLRVAAVRELSTSLQLKSDEVGNLAAACR